MNSTVNKHSIVIGSHKMSVGLEDGIWTSLKQIAHVRVTTVLDATRKGGNLIRHPRLSSQPLSQ
jgi:predicted DNA-binding ribbon-helix-helix protein